MPGPGRRHSRADSSRYLALGGEGEGALGERHSAIRVGTYWFTVALLTRSQPPPSARFSWINYRSRNRSPPCLVVGRPHVACPPPTTLLWATPDGQRGFRRQGRRAARPRLRLGQSGTVGHLGSLLSALASVRTLCTGPSLGRRPGAAQNLRRRASASRSRSCAIWPAAVRGVSVPCRMRSSSSAVVSRIFSSISANASA
jgi:hypothetical protein